MKDYYSLKCVKVPVRSTKVYYATFFQNVEFRFGNETQDGDFTLNHVIGYSEEQFDGDIVEYCTNYHLVGRYLGLREYGNENHLCIGEIQVIVE